MGGERILGLKIDVDTRRGMEEGVPVLLSALASASASATFFLSFGPDNSGKAVLQLLRNPRFLAKMVRTNAPGLYRWRTALYGTLLPAPMIARAFPGLCREIEARGFDKGIAAYEGCLGHPPKAFGAPAWMLTERAVSVLEAYPWRYLSCTRASSPFLLAGTGRVELSSDLPCLEEAGGPRGVGKILDALSAGGIHVLPVHAEAEGGIWRNAFAEILRGAAERGYRVVPLSGIADILRGRDLPERPFRMSLLPGRAVPCAV
ncbi:MAG: hypothetical protein HZB63_09125 [Deltaproteobacteria bacterium]|nr:hypothetical protein [Deltaproteobacteria bacterium]